MSPVWAMIVPLALFLTTTALLLGLTASLDPASRGPQRSFLHEAAEGYRYLWLRQEILQVTLAALAINFLSAVAFVVLGLYVTEWLSLGSPIYLGAMLLGSSVGAAVGTYLITKIHFEHRAGRFLAVFALLQGFMLVLMALSHSFWMAFGAFFLFGLFPGMFAIVFLATVQATVPNDRLGRVLAADEVGSYSLVPLGQSVGGAITVAASVQVTYLIAGAGTMLVGVAMISLRRLSRLAFVPSGGSGFAAETAGVPPGALGLPAPESGLPEPTIPEGFG